MIWLVKNYKLVIGAILALVIIAEFAVIKSKTATINNQVMQINQLTIVNTQLQSTVEQMKEANELAQKYNEEYASSLQSAQLELQKLEELKYSLTPTGTEFLKTEVPCEVAKLLRRVNKTNCVRQ